MISTPPWLDVGGAVPETLPQAVLRLGDEVGAPMYVVTALAVTLAALIATQLDPTVKAHRDSTWLRMSGQLGLWFALIAGLASLFAAGLVVWGNSDWHLYTWKVSDVLWKSSHTLLTVPVAMTVIWAAVLFPRVLQVSRISSIRAGTKTSLISDTTTLDERLIDLVKIIVSKVSIRRLCKIMPFIGRRFDNDNKIDRLD